ncbi:hypothetical protein D3C79_942850 [compost metagenome]
MIGDHGLCLAHLQLREAALLHALKLLLDDGDRLLIISEFDAGLDSANPFVTIEAGGSIVSKTLLLAHI